MKRIRKVITEAPSQKIQVISYYDLGDPEWQKNFLGREVPSYTLLPKTGKAGWGDPQESITTGIVRQVTLEEDTKRAVDILNKDDISSPIFDDIMKEFRLILKLTHREALDIPF